MSQVAARTLWDLVHVDRGISLSLSHSLTHSLSFGVFGRLNYWSGTPGTSRLCAERIPYVHRFSMVALPELFSDPGEGPSESTRTKTQ